MAAKVKPIPDEYSRVTPYLYVEDGARAIEFYKKVFGATERMRMGGPDGSIGHAELDIGGAIIMLADNPDASPRKRGGTTVSFVVYFEDVDKAWKVALDAGATEVQPLENKFYGDRMGTVRDPFGHEWSLGSHIEDVPAEEMERRMQEMAPMPS